MQRMHGRVEQLTFFFIGRGPTATAGGRGGEERRGERRCLKERGGRRRTEAGCVHRYVMEGRERNRRSGGGNERKVRRAALPADEACVCMRECVCETAAID